MINLKLLEKNFDEIKIKLEKKGIDQNLLKNLKVSFIINKEYNSLIEANQAEQNKLTKLFKASEEKDSLLAKIKDLKNEAVYLKDKRDFESEMLLNTLMIVPNIPADIVPFGKDENDNIEIKKVLEPRQFNFEPKPHWDLADGWIDFERGVKLAHSRFSVLNTKAAKLERALINFFLDENAKKGFQEISVPVLNNRKMLEGTGQLPKFENDLFKIENEDLYLIPTGEVPLTNLFNDEIIDEKELPLLLTTNTLCFRKEAGGAGRDTRGIIRQHQFNKVEMVAITKPENSDEIFQMMVDNASDLLTKLGLPHRLVELCGGDLGFSAARTIDLEVWIPSEGKYREISSVSNMSDFQARRAKIRFKNGNKNNLVNTLNGSALAVGRTIVAIMENYQNEDGTITMPEVLKRYL